ncbi:Sec-independent protein translocase subunit TatA [Corynebacterium sphenisci]|uniref:Sec-independent protein translocase subunit TatA n=1 Tax=Corynebacterium sphenisci TaxID=191493 RepID=UPI0026E0350F|nr:Sec-independent protein translocase subunit TatA [Corynebacterium sphenisci]MDO5730034.1 Sec-independent protein translocase subunit TatA [Corynebacterium sphenisci]
MPNLGTWELLIILLVVVLLFGAKRLPDAARSLGRSMRIFKSEVKEMQNDDAPAQQPQAGDQLPPAQQPVQPQPVEQPGQPQPQPRRDAGDAPGA